MGAYTLFSINLNIFLLPGIVSEVISLQYRPWVTTQQRRLRCLPHSQSDPCANGKSINELKAKYYPVLMSHIIWLQRIFHVVGSCCPQLVCEISIGTFGDVKKALFEASRRIFHLCNDGFAWHQSFVNQNVSCPCLISRQSNQRGLDFLKLTEMHEFLHVWGQELQDKIWCKWIKYDINEVVL